MNVAGNAESRPQKGKASAAANQRMRVEDSRRLF